MPNFTAIVREIRCRLGYVPRQSAPDTLARGFLGRNGNGGTKKEGTGEGGEGEEEGEERG